MPWCNRCSLDFELGTVRCARCNGPLLLNVSKGQVQSDARGWKWTQVYIGSEWQAALIQMEIEAANIPVMARRSFGAVTGLWESRLFVPEHFKKRVLEIIQQTDASDSGEIEPLQQEEPIQSENPSADRRHWKLPRIKRRE